MPFSRFSQVLLLGGQGPFPERAVGRNLIGDDQHKSYDKPHDPDLQAVSARSGVEDRETVCRSVVAIRILG